MANSYGIRKSYLELVKEADAFPSQHYEPEAYRALTRSYYKFKIKGHGDTVFGLVPEKVANEFRGQRGWTVNQRSGNLTLSKGIDANGRSNVFDRAMQSIVDRGSVSGLDGLCGDYLPVIGPGGEILLHIDHSASILLGTVIYGIQMLAYVQTPIGIRYWIPRRAKSRRAYPGMLDTYVGGALNSGETPLQYLVRKAKEEAALPENYVRANAKPNGVVSYHMATNANGEEGHQPPVVYTYVIELTPAMVPMASDRYFQMMSLEEVQDALARGQFKAECAPTWISYLISLGVINAENERHLYEITTHLHRRLDFPTR